MGLMRKRVARWASGKLHRLGKFIQTSVYRINKWGNKGHMDCRLCGTLCHMENINAEAGLCFSCSPTPACLQRPDEVPDAYVIPCGHRFLIQATNPKALEVLKFYAEALKTGFQRDTLKPRYKAHWQHIIRDLREKGMDVELHGGS